MKQYGATRVHPELLDIFITLIVDLHEFKLRPLLAILKEYGTIEKLELPKSENTSESDTLALSLCTLCTDGHYCTQIGGAPHNCEQC